MFNIGTGELFLILAVALIIFGPGKLPEIGRTLGKAMSEMRKATQEIQNSIQMEDINLDERPSPPAAGPRPEADTASAQTAAGEQAASERKEDVDEPASEPDEPQPVTDSEPAADPDDAEDDKTLGR